MGALRVGWSSALSVRSGNACWAVSVSVAGCSLVVLTSPEVGVAGEGLQPQGPPPAGLDALWPSSLGCYSSCSIEITARAGWVSQLR